MIFWWSSHSWNPATPKLWGKYKKITYPRFHRFCYIWKPIKIYLSKQFLKIICYFHIFGQMRSKLYIVRGWHYPEKRNTYTWLTINLIIVLSYSYNVYEEILKLCSDIIIQKISAPAWNRTGCEFDFWQCRINIPCSLSLRLLGSFRGSLGTYRLTQKLC